MKTLKSKIIAGVSALTLVAGSFFIVNAMEKKTELPTSKTVQAGEQWFKYIGGNPALPSSYELHGDGSSSPDECVIPPTEQVCSLKAQPSGSNPDQPNMSTVIDTRYTPEN